MIILNNYNQCIYEIIVEGTNSVSKSCKLIKLVKISTTWIWGQINCSCFNQPTLVCKIMLTLKIICGQRITTNLIANKKYQIEIEKKLIETIGYRYSGLLRNRKLVHFSLSSLPEHDIQCVQIDW